MEKTFKNSKKNFFLRILLPTFITIILFISVFFFVFIPQFENTVMDRKREMIKELTNSAHSILEKWHKEELSGKIDKTKAQEFAVSQIKSLRYGEEGKDYFWITNYQPVMIMHPYRSDLNQKDLSNFKDSHGKTLFVEMAEKAKTNNDAFVDYMWQWKDDSTKIVPKLSYVKSFKPWQWIIGTGIYVEDVKEEIAQLENKIINVSAGISFLISLLLVFIAYQNINAEKKRHQAEFELHESREKYRTLVEASTEGLIMILDDGQTFFNKTLYNMLGYEGDSTQLQVANLFNELPKLHSVDLTTLKILSDDENLNDQTETLIKKCDGTFLNALIIASPITLLNSKGIVLSVRDITLSKKIEEELDKSKEKYLALAEKLSIGVFRVNVKKDFKITQANQAALNILKIETKELVTDFSLSDFFEERNELEHFKNDLLNSGSIQNRSVNLRIGELQFAAAISALLIKTNDENVFADVIIEDISEQRRTIKVKDDLINNLQTAFYFLGNSIFPFIKPIPSVAASVNVKDAITTMQNENCDCLLIENSDESPIGFFSSDDIKKRVLINYENLDKSIYHFMSSPLITIKENSNLLEAVTLLNKNNVEYLLATNNNDKIIGVLRAHEIQKAFHSSYLFFINKIKNSNSVAELKSIYEQLVLLIRSLAEKQTNIQDLTKLISEISDSITERVLSLAENKLGKAPVEYSFIVLGSSGRQEQTLATDQDNAIIFEDVEKENDAAVQNYFLKLGERVSADLNYIGYNFCKGEIMAKNKKWCQPLSVWKNYFTHWITNSSPQDLLEVKIFFDFRTVYGSRAFSDQLKDHISKITSGYNSFFVYLSEGITQFQIPDAAIKLKSPFDIKIVMLPIIDYLRLYSIKKKIFASNSVERLEILYSKGVVSKTTYRNILNIYNFLMQKRLEHQSSCLAQNRTTDNLINPLEFSEIDLTIIKKIIALIEELQSKTALEIKGTMIS